ncbi:MAG: response regulator transcription factor [Gordonibacter sp.]|uniref:response regulator transcription factor n=2 Tax=Gordonibacter sp. TaxID=1968902 RepID=UPI002FCB3AFB
MEARTILIVEDDPDINALLSKIMEREGYTAIQAFSGTEALLRLEHTAVDLILLDMMLPGMDGPTLIAEVRGGRKLNVPVVVVSAKAGLSDKVDMLARGADDYIVKPFQPEEVAARVRAVLRRSAGAGAVGTKGSYEYRSLRLDVPTRRASLEGVDLSLTAHEFDILHILIQEPDKVFSRERLYELVWKGGYYGEDNAVNVHVSNIRKKLAAIDPEGAYVKTVWGIGFKLS